MEPLERENQILEIHQLALARYQSADRNDAVTLMRQVVLHYADFETTGVPLLRSNIIHKKRAFACEQCADMLMEREEYPEAASLYQEAVDVFGSLQDSESMQHAGECAHKTVVAINSLRAKPQDRLKLLIAHYERKLQQLRIQSGTALEQAQVHVEVAKIYMRRERYTESRVSYKTALHLFEFGNSDSENVLRCAECHHQLGNLARYRFHEMEEAIAHYERAIPLYDAVTSLETYDPSSRAMCQLALKEIEELFTEGSRAFGEGHSGL